MKKQQQKSVKLAHITILIWLLLYTAVAEQTRLIFRIMCEVDKARLNKKKLNKFDMWCEQS